MGESLRYMVNTATINKNQTALEICHLYYEDGLSQNEIAKKLNISRPTISRLLAYAKENGMVQIKIIDPKQDLSLLQIQLKKKYQLKDVLIAENFVDDSQIINDKLGKLTASYLNKIVKDNDIIGISWGHTLTAVANHLIPNEHSNIKVVQLKGSMSESDLSDYANEINQKFAQAFHTNTINLPLPTFLDNAITKDIVIKDKFIHQIYETGIQSNIAIYTTGTVQDHTKLFSLGYLSNQEITELRHSAVGDIVSRFIDQDGNIINPALNNRTTGIDLEHLRQKDYSILVAGAKKKLISIHGALSGHYANVLITDKQTAMDLLDKY